MFKHLYTKPFEDSDDEWIDMYISRLARHENLTPKYRPSLEEIITVIEQLIDLVLDGLNTREDVKQIFKRYV